MQSAREMESSRLMLVLVSHVEHVQALVRQELSQRSNLNRTYVIKGLPHKGSVAHKRKEKLYAKNIVLA